MKHILVTTDFSALADLALAPAADLARRLGAKLTLAHILGAERPPEPDENAPYYKVAKRLWDADQELEAQALAALQERNQNLPDLACDVIIARGSPVDGIVKLAQKVGADLIVISSQGRTGLSRILLGSVAEEMARVSPVPVLIWKQPQA